MRRNFNSGYISAKDKRASKDGAYGLSKHILERLGGNFLAPTAVTPAFTDEYSVVLDGTNDFIALASEITFSGPFTLSFWVNPSAKLYGTIAYGSSGSYVDHYGTVGGTTYGDKILVRNMGTINTADDTVETGVWRNILVVRDSSNVVKVYTQGVQSGSSSTFSGDATINKFGGTGHSSTFFFGYLNDIAFWDSDQTSNKAAIFNSGAPSSLSSLSPLHWWRMGDNDGGAGTTITDQGSGGNDATLTNGASFSTETP